MASIFRKLFSSTPKEYVELPTTDKVATPKPTYKYAKPAVPFNTNIAIMNVTTKNNEFSDTEYVKIDKRYYKIKIDDSLSDYSVAFDSYVRVGSNIDIVAAPTTSPAEKVLVNVVGMTFDSESCMRSRLDGLDVDNASVKVGVVGIRYRHRGTTGDGVTNIIDSSTKICCPNIKNIINGVTFGLQQGTDKVTESLKYLNRGCDMQHSKDNVVIQALYEFSSANKIMISYLDFHGLDDKEIAVKLTSVFNQPYDEIYIVGVDLVIQYVDKKNFNLFLFNHLRTLCKSVKHKYILQHLCGDVMFNFW